MAAKKREKAGQVAISKDADQLKEEWLRRLDGLVREVDSWAKDLDWSTRTSEKRMEDPEIGTFRVPLLIMQKEAARVLLEPIGRSGPGGESMVDLYLLPAYDDIASLYYYDNGWNLHYPFPGSPAIGDIRQAEARPLTKESLQAVLEEMVRDGA